MPSLGSTPWFSRTDRMATRAKLFLLNLDSLSIWQWFMPALPWLTFFWLFGTFLLQGRMMVNWLKVQRMKSRGTQIAPVEWQRTVMDLCDLLHVRKTVYLFETSLAHVPMVMGWLKPVILVPGYVLTGLTPQQLRAVLAHELAHVRRHDYQTAVPGRQHLLLRRLPDFITPKLVLLIKYP